MDTERSEKRRSLTRWIVHAGLALAALIALSWLWTGSRAPPPPVTLPPPKTDGERLFLAEADREAGVRSLLNVPDRMRYGDFRWNETGVPSGPVWVRVDRAAQIVSVFRAGHEIGTAVIVYGASDKPTPTGRYPVLGKARFHRSRAYDADMPFTLWLTSDGVAIHAAEVRDGRATHGCIGVPPEFARRLFDAVGKDDPVVIV